MGFNIKKGNGHTEKFDKEKLRRSLIGPGASAETADRIIKHIEHNLSHFNTTDDIYKYALDRLQEHEPHIATRYNLKRAMLEFGPSGFPFEKYIVEIFKSKGYRTKLDQIVGGFCVDHEIDIILEKDDESSFVECKFHNVQYYTTDVQVALYVDARFHDLKKTWRPSNRNEVLRLPWIVTNTKFTFEAIKYGNCKHINLLAWNYPKKESLAHIIDQEGLYPITALVFLDRKQKEILLQNGIFLCRDVQKNADQIRKLGISSHDIERIIHSCYAACKVVEKKEKDARNS